MVFKTLVGSSKRVSKPKKYLIKWGSQVEVMHVSS